MKRLLTIASIAIIVASGLLYWGSSFASNMVRDQLAEQKIEFPSKDQLTKEGEKAEIIKYAGQKVDNGKEAKAYSEYIKGHLKKVADGKTYSEVSAEFQKDNTNQKLAGQRQTLFMGETLRGLLLNAWGWGLVGEIAYYASLAVLIVGVGLLIFARNLLGLRSRKTALSKPASKKFTRK